MFHSSRVYVYFGREGWVTSVIAEHKGMILHRIVAHRAHLTPFIMITLSVYHVSLEEPVGIFGGTWVPRLCPLVSI